MYVFILFYLFSSIICFSLGLIIYLRNKNSLLNKLFFCFNILLSFFFFSEFMWHHPLNEELITFWLKARSLWIFGPSFLLHFTLLFTGNSKFFKKKFAFPLIYVPPLIFSITTLFTKHLLSKPLKLEWSHSYDVREVPWFNWTNDIWAGILTLLSLILILQYYLKTTNIKKKAQAKIIFISIFIPAMSMLIVDELFPIFKVYIPSVTPIFILISAVLLGYAMWKYELFNFSPEKVARKIISTITDPLIIINRDGKVIYVNKATLNLLGYTEYEIVEKTVDIILGDSQKDNFQRKILNELLSKGLINDCDFELRTKGGKLVPVILTCSLLKDKLGEVFGIILVAKDITERKRMENELKKERDLTQKYFDLAEVMLVILSPDKRVLHINKKGSRILGYSPEEIIGKNWFENFLPKRYKIATSEVFYKLLSGSVESVEYNENPVLTKSGEERLIRWHNAILKNEKDEIIAIISTGEDITEQKKMEEELERHHEHLIETVEERTLELKHLNEQLYKEIALRQQREQQLIDSERKFKELFEKSVDGIIIIKTESKKFYIANQTMSQMLGYTQEELSEMEIKSIHPQEDLPYVLEIFEKMVKGKLSQARNIPVQRKDGTIFYADISSFPLFIDGNECLVGVFRDVTNRKITEDALKESERRYRILFNSIKDAILFCELEEDKIGKIIDVNDNASEMLGYAKDELLGMLFEKLTAPENINMVVENSRKLLSNKHNLFELPILKKDGQKFVAEINSNIFYYKTETVVLATIRDISERKQIEEKLRQGEEKFRTVVDNIGIGISIISPKMEIISLNNQMKKWFPNIDVSTKPICYKAFNDPPGEKICHYCPVCKTLQDGLVHEAITETPAGNEIRNYRIISSPLTDKDGNITGVIEMVDDITEKLKMEEELIKSHENLDRQVHQRTMELLKANESLQLEIEERKKIIDTLNFERNQLLSIFDSVDESIYVADPETYEVLYANSALKKVFGQDIIGKKCYKTLQAQDSPCEFCTNKYIFGKNLGNSYRWEWKNQITERWYQCFDRAIRWPDGRWVRYEMAIDIDDRKQMEIELKESESQYRSTLNSIGEPLYVVNRELKILLANTAFEKWAKELGIESEIVGKKVFDVFPFLPNKIKNEYNKIFEMGEVLVTEESLEIGGKEVITESRKIPVFEKGIVVRVVSIIKDITQKRLVEDALKGPILLWQETFDTFDEAICLLDVEGKIYRTNKAMREFLQKSSTEIIGKTCCEIVHGSPVPIEGCPFIKMKKTLKKEKMLLTVNNKSFNVYVTPLVDEEKNLIGAVHIISSISA